MKKQLQFILFVLAGTFIISTDCKAQGQTSAYTQHLLDSLKITDSDEIALANLYDEAITEYMTELKAYTTNGTKPTDAQTAEVRKKFQQKSKDIQPQLESLKKKLASNYPLLMTFMQFWQLETMRVFGGMMPPGMGGRPGYPMPAGMPGYPMPANPNTPPPNH